jgi:hypothetical protein
MHYSFAINDMWYVLKRVIDVYSDTLINRLTLLLSNVCYISRVV